MSKHVQSVANCVYCANAPLIIFSSFLGSSCFSIRCIHVTENYKMKPSRVRIVLSLLSAFLMFFKTIHFICTKDDNSSEDKLTNFLKQLADCLSSASCAFLITNNLFSTRDRILFYEGIFATLNEGKNYGINHLLQADTVKQFRTRGYIIVILSISCALIYSLALNKIGNVLTIYVYMVISFCYTSEMLMHKEMLLTCYRHLKMLLTKRRKEGESCVQRKIQNVQRMHMCIVHNFEYCNTFCGRTVFMGLIFAITIAILYVYVLLIELFFEDAQFCIWEQVEVMLFLTFLFLPGAYNVSIIEDVYNASNNVLSFLFRYPISKLNADEAAQVELLITTLTIQKPILRASNIFTVGTRLLASISGTVVTYLLVALQFHMTWTRKSVNAG